MGVPMTDIFADSLDAASFLGSLDDYPLASRESFVQEERDLMRRRARLVFGLGLGITAILILLSRVAIGGVWGPWERVLDLSILASFGAGLAVLYTGSPGLRRLHNTAFAVIALNAVLVVVNIEALQVTPDYPSAVILALVLFVPAAVIPWRVGHQMALGVIAVLSPIIVRIVMQTLEGVSGLSVAAFWQDLLVSSVVLIVLAATSVLVTNTLYSLRRKAHKARKLGNYTIERELGKGGMGEVFVARHARMVRPSAVKVLRVSSVLDEEALARFEREVQTSSSLTHPNTITIYDYGRADRLTFYYAMEYLEGMDLNRLVKRFGPVSAARAIHVLHQVCGSLAEAHDRQVMHRDLKPANIFLTQRGGLFDFVKVLDFGLAKQVQSGQQVTRKGLLVGTPEYMSPEAIHGDFPVDTRSDIYCLGAVAYYLLTGSPPFSSKSAMQLLIDQVKKPPEPPSRITEIAVPEALETAILRCLEKRPEDRFQRVQDLDATLRKVPLEEQWSNERATEWWEVHVEDMRPVLYESAPGRAGSPGPDHPGSDASSFAASRSRSS
jgi:serine/threonine-protein kinase